MADIVPLKTGALGPMPRNEVMEPVYIEIRPVNLKDLRGQWRVYPKGGRYSSLALRDDRGRGGALLGGTLQQAHEDATRYAHTHQFIYEPPDDVRALLGAGSLPVIER